MLVHDFQVADSKGTELASTSRATAGGRDGWTNESFTRKEGRLESMIKVRQEKLKRGGFNPWRCLTPGLSVPRLREEMNA